MPEDGVHRQPPNHASDTSVRSCLPCRGRRRGRPGVRPQARTQTEAGGGWRTGGRRPRWAALAGQVVTLSACPGRRVRACGGGVVAAGLRSESRTAAQATRCPAAGAGADRGRRAVAQGASGLDGPRGPGRLKRYRFAGADAVGAVVCDRGRARLRGHRQDRGGRRASQRAVGRCVAGGGAAVNLGPRVPRRFGLGGEGGREGLPGRPGRVWPIWGMKFVWGLDDGVLNAYPYSLRSRKR